MQTVRHMIASSGWQSEAPWSLESWSQTFCGDTTTTTNHLRLVHKNPTMKTPQSRNERTPWR
jgi:hypothetical protein